MNDMKIYELEVKVFLLKDINFENIMEKSAKFIDTCLVKHNKFKELHYNNKYKNYSFNAFSEFNERGMYKKGRVYTLKIRSIDNDLIKHLELYLKEEATEYFKGLIASSRTIKRVKYIDDIYSRTPVVIKTDHGYWKNSLSLIDFEDRLRGNLIKKYNNIMNTKIDEDFELFRCIEIKNIKPFATVYKGNKILGDRLVIKIAESEQAQKIAFMTLGCGLGEMNSRGYGFINTKCF